MMTYGPPPHKLPSMKQTDAVGEYERTYDGKKKRKRFNEDLSQTLSKVNADMSQYKRANSTLSINQLKKFN